MDATATAPTDGPGDKDTGEDCHDVYRRKRTDWRSLRPDDRRSTCEYR
jgi:hypothetical protein